MATATKPGSWSETQDRTKKNQAHLNAMETTAPKGGCTIVLPKLDIRTIEIKVVGDSELICHHWSAKAIREILEKQMGIATAGREKKVPHEDYWETLYHLQPQKYPHKKGHRYGFPSIAFKCAAVEACTSLGRGAITKVAARQAFHVMGELVEIHGTPRMREDMVRLNGGPADVRHRGGFPEWWTKVRVRYNARVLSAEQVVNLFNTSGFAVGIGEWRSERDGGFGLFHVE